MPPCLPHPYGPSPSPCPVLAMAPVSIFSGNNRRTRNPGTRPTCTTHPPANSTV